ncbi:MAG: radical SAM protein [Polyangiaceae bacterium]|jgi:wyosine [tRNA(Phe)-imidazoG37] synthetase (radical SAM superfamily)|nr:radical SAM protein [Polyangiaceae bacterium]
MPRPRRVHLSTIRHETDEAGLRYVYAVLSRRAGGVSIGVNVSTNHACNWRCVYCQVPGLVRGTSPPVDLDILEQELKSTLEAARRGELFDRGDAKEAPEVVDVAFSGDGEPTTSPDFGGAVERVGKVLREAGLSLPVILITNGSRVASPRVQQALRALADLGGVVWFKLDRATREGLRATNGTAISPERHLARLRTCAALCPTWIQSCFTTRGGAPPAQAEVDAWLAALSALTRDHVPVRGVLLYTLARPSHQPEAAELDALDKGWLDELAEKVRALGLEARVSI